MLGSLFRSFCLSRRCIHSTFLFLFFASAAIFSSSTPTFPDGYSIPQRHARFQRPLLILTGTFSFASLCPIRITLAGRAIGLSQQRTVRQPKIAHLCAAVRHLLTANTLLRRAFWSRVRALELSNIFVPAQWRREG